MDDGEPPIRQTRHIVLLVPPHAESLEGIHVYCAAKTNWSFMIQSATELRAITHCLKECDGMIGHLLREDQARTAAASGVPCVNVGYLPNSPIPVVTTDQEAVGRIGAQHLLGCGFREFAFLGSQISPGSPLRKKGFLEEVQKAGHRCHVHYALQTDDWLALRADLAAWIHRLPKPLAMMANNDSLGHQALDTCRVLGIKVPGQIAVVGAGNILAVCRFATPPLSSIPYNGRQIGYQAAELLDRMMAGEPAPPAHIPIPPMGVVVRPSSSVVAFADPQMAKAIRFVDEHACDGIGVEDILAAVRLSRRSLERRFRQTLGRSPHEHIRFLQVDRAKRLLIDTRIPLSEVAKSSGFPTVWALGVVFRQAMAMSPGEFRKRLGPPQ